MTLDLGTPTRLNVFRQELSRLGIRLLPPDINRSEVTFAVEPPTLTLPRDLSQARGSQGKITKSPRSATRSPQ